MQLSIVKHIESDDSAFAVLSQKSIKVLLKVDFETGLVFLLKVLDCKIKSRTKIRLFYKKMNLHLNEKHDLKPLFSIKKLFAKIDKQNTKTIEKTPLIDFKTSFIYNRGSKIF